jgi:hypothetical protein
LPLNVLPWIVTLPAVAYSAPPARRAVLPLNVLF